MKNKDKRIAMLIDGDNAQASLLSNIIEEISRYGRITIKRIYGDWTSTNMKSWKEQLNTFAIKPIQKFAYAKGKNSTDIALIIDAMDILHRAEIDGFCLVSSDSDFTGLANRIRESGLFVIGIGAQQTPKPFINSCDIFTFKENFSTEEKPKSKKKKKIIDLNFIHKAYSMAEQEEEETAHLSKLAQTIRKLDPSFDPRTYEFKNFVALFQSLNKNYELIFHKEKKIFLVKQINK